MALSTRIPGSIWHAKYGRIYVDRNENVTFGASNTLSGSFVTATAGGTQFTAAVKNITITPPETPHDKIDFVGVDSNQFQNQLLEQKPVGLATITCSMIIDRDELVEDYMVSGTVTGATGYSRYQLGEQKTVINDLAVCVSFDHPIQGAGVPTKYVAYAMKNARMNKFGDIKIASDGYLEQDISITCLAKDFYYEFKN